MKFRVAVRKYDPFESALKKMWEQFCQKTNCNLALELVPMDLHELYDSTLGKEAGLKKGLWDVAYINTDWMAQAYADNSLLNLTPFIEKDPPENFPNGWSNSLLSAQKFGDVILGLPFHDGPECLIYRKDLFENKIEQDTFFQTTGRQLEVPTTWDAFYEVARFFHRPEKNLYGTVFAAFPDGHNTVFDFCVQLWSRGGILTDRNDRININSVEALEGLEFYRKLLKDDKVIHPQSHNFDSVKSGLAFADGQIAMMINWFGFASMCEVVKESKVKGKVDITSIPHTQNAPPISLNAYWLYCIGMGSKNQEMAYKFIAEAISNKNDKLLTLEGGTGCRKSTWSDKEINEAIPYYYRLEKLHENARMLPRKIEWFKISEIIDSVVLKAMQSNINAKDILNKAQEKIDQIHNK